MACSEHISTELKEVLVQMEKADIRLYVAIRITRALVYGVFTADMQRELSAKAIADGERARRLLDIQIPPDAPPSVQQAITKSLALIEQAISIWQRIERMEEIDVSQSADDARDLYVSAANGLREVREIYYVPSKIIKPSG